MCQNIDDFNYVCALIFARLYRGFPRGVALTVADLDDGADLLDHERVARLRQRREVAAAALEFLCDEGFVTWKDAFLGGEDSNFYGLRLTSKGLVALNKVPAAIRPPGKTVGDTLIDMGHDAVKLAARETLVLAVRTVLGG